MACAVPSLGFIWRETIGRMSGTVGLTRFAGMPSSGSCRKLAIASLSCPMA